MVIKSKIQENPEHERSKSNIATLSTPVLGFIPYACHYDKDTILTKNGELLQTIEIKGFSNKKTNAPVRNIRDEIRKSITETIKSTQFAVYFHTIRHTMNLDDAPKFPNYFSQRMHKTWVNINDWDKKHVNNLYVTIVRKGTGLKFSTFIKKPLINLIIKTHEKALSEAYEELNHITSSLIKQLDVYDPIKLGMVKDKEKGYCSTLLKFFSKIIHIKESDFPIEIEELAKSLAINKVAFGYNALEIEKDNKKFFATIFSIKENNEINIVSLGKLLQMPQKLVITQAINFIDTQEGYKDIKHQRYILEVSRDSDFKKSSDLNEVEKININERNIFCTTQTTIMVIAEDIEELKSESIQVYEKLSNLGLPAVKEDLNMEHCFWSQLPANFTYIVRKTKSLSAKMGNFALLNNLPFGELNNPWGKPITLFETLLYTPYFFNFHVKNNGHTIIVGDDDNEKSVIINFLLSEALKFKPKFLYLDSNKKAELFMKAIGVEYKIFNFDKNLNQLKMNPLQLEDNEANRTFLKYWFIFLLNKYTNPSAIKKYLPVISKAIEVLYSLPKEQRKLSNIESFFTEKTTEKTNKEIITNLQDWIGEGSLAHIFDNDSDYLIEKKGENLTIDIYDIYDTSMGFNLPILTYILYFFKEYFTGDTPSILCVAEGSRAFNSVYFEKNLEYILDDIGNRNSMLLIHASFCSEKVNWSDNVAKIYNRKIKTQIFMADSAASYNNTTALFNLNGQETMYLQSLVATAGQFLLKQDNISLVLQLDLSNSETEFGILSGDKHYVKIAKNLIEKEGNDPSIWLPSLYKKQQLE